MSAAYVARSTRVRGREIQGHRELERRAIDRDRQTIRRPGSASATSNSTSQSNGPNRMPLAASRSDLCPLAVRRPARP